MNIQLNLFDETEDEKKKSEFLQKIECLATGKHLRGLKRKDLWEAHQRKISELFGKE